ncbi:MAG: DUF2267 domain-containing protein [Elainellaceae cyanobacterium]
MQSASNSMETTTNSLFLERVKRAAGLEDLYDARDVAEVVFRTMRDVMTTEASDRVASELQGKVMSTGDSGTAECELAQLWQDTNPVVRALSRVRPPLEIKPETFVFRISQEAGISRGIDPLEVTEAIFSAFKQELSPERIKEISDFMPGDIRQVWRRA